jgi:NitT/TauT family transport system ATP-binding protein
VEILEPVLRFNLLQGAGRPPRQVDRFIRFDPAALRPDPGHAEWILAGMEQAGQTVRTPEMLELARAVYRPALFAGSVG